MIVVWTGIAIAVILRAAGLMGEEPWRALGLALLPGVMFWMISFLTKEKVGYGDGWVLLLIGSFAGISKCVLILLAGLAIQSVVLLVLLAFRRVGRDKEIPFAPFLLAGLGVATWI